MEEAVYIGILISSLGYSLLQSIQQGKQIASVNTQLAVLQNNVALLNQKLDIFMRNEVDALKDIAMSVKK